MVPRPQELEMAAATAAVYGKDVQPGVQGDFTVRLLVPLLNELCWP